MEEARSDKWRRRNHQTENRLVRIDQQVYHELYLHQDNGDSDNAQKCQSSQDNPVVVVDSKRSKSKYSCKTMRSTSLYCITILTDDTNVSSFTDNILSANEDLAAI